MNPRYLAYCRAHGRTPEAQLEHDRKVWPGACMCGFILWINARLRAFEKQHPEAMCGSNVHDQNEWTTYLQTP